MIYAQFYQGRYASTAVCGYGWVGVGAVFQSAGGTPGVFTVGTLYTVTAVTPDPAGNPNVPASYPGDTVTLTTLGTIPASSLANGYRVS